MKHPIIKSLKIATMVTVTSTLAMASSATAATLKVTIESLAPENGTLFTPVWVGFHNGSFDIYDRDQAASPGLERIAEDGNAAVLSQEFFASGAGSVDGVIPGPNGPVASGDITKATFTVDSTSRYFSYAAMILPSNDAFIANGNPLAFEIFDEEGNFTGADFTILGSQVLDAGTEVNDEQQTTTAFFGQSIPDTGTPENGVVTLHPGFIPGGPILSTPAFAEADFTVDGYQIARIKVEKVPESSTTGGLLAIGGLLWLGSRWRQSLNRFA
ncbi:spondin domain-containing protein [Moorena producens JHB]|uniref:Spondin domain-containing protein n=1 Tax=Moorena producens (strain JHB) TaxID=1454205 RepID=A0A1D9FW02_MOOP1|nr:spondin domain-containing protein [Moorena producens]AOY79521.1 spondin domain-containing protein [Moorena producens JHB]